MQIARKEQSQSVDLANLNIVNDSTMSKTQNGFLHEKNNLF